MGCCFLMGLIRVSITPSAKRNTLPFRVAKRRAGDLRFSVAPPFIYSTQGRGAAHLNPGLGKRNSYRVAGGAYLTQWTNYTWSLGAYLPQWANYTRPLGAYLSQWANYTWSLGAYLPQWANYTWPLGAYLPQWTNYTLPLGADHQYWANIILALVALYSGLERKTWANLLILSPSIGTMVTICNQIAVIM